MEIENLKADRKDSLRLEDGRVLSWYEWGPREGKPVLFCTGAGMSGSLAFAKKEAAQYHLRFIAIDRPGLGSSDSHSEKNLLSWTRDVSELLAQLKLEMPHVVGFSQGAPFAYALARYGVACKVAIVSGQDDFAKESVHKRLPAEVSNFVKSIQSHEKSFLQQFAKMADADGLFQLILSMSSDKDRSFYEVETFKASYRQCLQEGFQQGSIGYVQDLVNTYSQWPFQLEEISTPIDLWYGALDTSPVHSPDFGKELALRIPNCRLHFFDNEGGSVLWTRSKEIIEILLQP